MRYQYIPYNNKLVDIAREQRINPTEAERRLWDDVLKDKKLGEYKFHRQKPLGNFIADFYCQELMLVIEVDGDYHKRQKEYDELRSEKLGEYGISVLRFTNEEIIQDIDRINNILLDKLNSFPPDKGD